ncbi:tripartite tricarboxylate transporter TctB family protein [Ruegeria hyattellae]|uniref:tripartite tricarboxylate transporter TctB family protein n=1 Tax=Ruegeria hyattellae TaxID=3233337 RepID=UPI00355AF479
MDEKALQLRLGIGACVASAVLVLFAIPNFVTAPSNVLNVVLSPLFWPYTLSALTGVAGLALIAASLRMPNTGEPVNEASDERGAAILRMIGIIIIMLVSLYLFKRLGLVWTCVLAFLATAFLVKTRHPITAIVCAVIIPLLLYAFFTHVAGVAIPQGNFVRLP